MKPVAITFLFLLLTTTSMAQQNNEASGQPETFTMQWGDSTIVMQKYFIAFLKAGPNRNQSKEESAKIQEQHLAHLDKLYLDGKTSITGPFGDDGDIRGVVVFNTATIEEARILANQDPAVRAGRLVVEIHPWWAAKGSKLK